MDANDLKVLSIVDTADNLARLRAAVKSALPGCAILTTRTGPRGIALARSENPDVILLDFAKPGANGIELCRKLKADPRAGKIPVVFVTSSRGSRNYRAKAIDAGGDAFLSRPVDALELGVQVRAMAKLKAAARLRRPVRKKAAARSSEHNHELRYQSLFDNMLNGFAYCRMEFEGEQPKDFIYLAVNKAFEKQTGLTDVEGKWVSEVIPGIRQSDPALFEIYGRVARTGQPEHFEMLVAALKQWFSVTVYSPSAGHFVAVFDVITERKRAEAALMEGEERYRRLFESMAQGVVYQRGDGTIVSANPAAERILGLSHDQILGKTSMDPGWKTVREDGSDLPGQDHPAMVTLRTGRRVERFVMGVFNPRSSSHSWISVTSTPLFQPGDEKPSQVYTTFDEITEQRRVEQAIQDGEAFTRAVLDHLPVGIAVNSVDPDVTFSYMNDNFPRFYRTTRERLAEPDAFWNAVYEDPSFREEMRRRVLDDCASGDVERMYWADIPITREGELTTFITARNTPVPGHPLSISTVWDVTDRKRAEEALRRRDVLLRQTQQITKVGGWEYEVDGGRVTWTDEVYRIHGVTPDQFNPDDIARNAAFYKDPETIDSAFRRAVELGEPYDLELDFRNARGEDLRVRTIGNAEIRDGKVVRVFGSIMDITAQRVAEAEHERLLAAIEQTGEAVFVTDPEGIIQYVNPAFETVSGYRREEIIGHDARFLGSGEQDEAFSTAMHQAIASGKSWQGTLVNKRKDGTLYTEESTISPVFDAGGRVVSCVGVGRDITRQRLVEDQLRQSQKMETVGQLAGGVAHDFNNMLQVIITYAELSLAKVDAGQPTHKYLQEIRRAAQRSAEITGQLLAFARKQTVSPKVLDLNDAVANTRKMIQRLIGEDIDLAWMPGHELWKVRIDPAQLDQIFANLAVNARDAIGGVGKLTIETDKVTLDEAYCSTHAGILPGQYVLLAVSDDGSGMDKETMSHLFEPFFTTKGPGKGTGLGLATVYGIVRQNNGFINVDSEPGRGSSFKVYLPRAEGVAETEGTETEAAAPRGGTETILITEDEAAILELAREILEQLGYTVLTAKSPEEAMRRSGQHAGPIDLLITDVVMPQMNGRELCDRLVAGRPGLKCLYMSGYTADVIAHRGILEEGVSFIAKPFSLAVLAEKVREVLDG